MPIYEYACGICGHLQEAFQGIKDAPLTECEQCHKPSLTRLISAAGFRLKGSGWYETDFKSGTDKKRNLAEGFTNSTASTSSKSEGSTSTEKPVDPKPSNSTANTGSKTDSD